MGKSGLVWSEVHPCIYSTQVLNGPMPVDDEGMVSILALHIASYALRIGVSVMEL